MTFVSRIIIKMFSYLKYFYKRIIIHNIERFIRRSYLVVNYSINKKDINPVFIIASARSGSYLLLSYLESHPEIYSLGEIINPDIVRGIRDRNISKREVLFHIKASLNSSKKRIGIAKLLSYQMKSHNLDIDEIRNEFPNAQFIVLYRKSLIEQYISYELSKASGIWKIDKKKSSKKWKENDNKINVTPTELESFCSEIKEFYNNIFNKKWVQDEALLLSYEELVQIPKDFLSKKLFSFLGLPEVEIETEMKKMNEKNIEDIVENYTSIKNILEDKKYLLREVR